MRRIMSWALVVAVSLGLAVPCLAAKAAPLVNKQTLKSWLNDPDLLIIDVRLGSYVTSKKKITGAVRKDPYNVGSWASSLPKDKKIVLYCSWPDEATSARVAQQLLDKGFSRVYVLKGGWWDWEDAGYPMEPKK